MDMTGLKCELCDGLVRVPCKSNCRKHVTTCYGGVACYTCIYDHYKLDKPHHRRGTPWCISCGFSDERTPRNGSPGNHFSVMSSLFDSLDKVVNSSEHCICSWCGEVSGSQESLLDHIRERCPGLVVRCPSCPRLFLGKRSFVFGDHYEKYHAKTKCTKCNFTYRNRDHRQHLNAHLDDFRNKKNYYEKSIQEVEDMIKKHEATHNKSQGNRTTDRGPCPTQETLKRERKRARDDCDDDDDDCDKRDECDVPVSRSPDPLDILLGEV
jgi:hypothetical protein